MDNVLLGYLQVTISSDRIATMTSLYDLLHKAAVDITTDRIDAIGAKDTLDVDTCSVGNEVEMLLKEGLISYLKHIGIIVDEEILMVTSLHKLVMFMDVLKHISELDVDQAEYILDNIDVEETDEVEKLFYILSNTDNTLDAELYFNLVTDIIPTTIKALLLAISNIVESIAVEDEDDMQHDVKVLDMLHEELELSVVPDLLSDIMGDRVNTIARIENNFTDMRSSIFKKLNFFAKELGFEKRVINKYIVDLVLLYAFSNNTYNDLVLDLYDKCSDKHDFRGVIKKTIALLIELGIIENKGEIDE